VAFETGQEGLEGAGITVRLLHDLGQLCLRPSFCFCLVVELRSPGNLREGPGPPDCGV
jgi:hypothetical protein